MSAEPLEERRLLAQVSLQPTTGVLEISGDLQAESVLVTQISAGTLRVRLEANGRPEDYDFPASGVARVSFLGRDGDDVFRNESSIPATALGGEGDDTLIGGSADDTLEGNNGNDRLLGRGGNDSIEGGAGDDRLEGGAGKDVLNGSAGDDTIYGDDGNDQLYGGDGNDQLYGGGGNDVLRGFDGDDVLDGGDGNDELLGMVGNDRILGGAGSDLLDGGSEDDILEGLDGDDLLDGGTGNDVLAGGAGDDVLRGGVGSDVLKGEAGNDDLSGFEGDDYLYGGEGDDLLDGKQGRDVLYGDAGNDRLIGGSDDDFLGGGIGDDSLDGGMGVDVILGEDGQDTLYGGEGADYLIAGDGDDVLHGFDGDDLLLGGNGDDYIDAAGGNDILVGGAGMDVLDGGGEDDLLIGGEDADTLNGRSGSDLLIGGATTYDRDATLLGQIRDLWASSLGYNARIFALEDSLFPAYLLTQKTVLDDAVADDIFGDEGRDWFFLTGALPTYVPADAKQSSHEGGARHHLDQPPTSIMPSLEGFALIDSLDELRDVASDENVHTAFPHRDNPSKMGEHLAFYELIRYDHVTHTAIASGPWTSPNTWRGGNVPTSDANVLIPVGVEVTVDGVLDTEFHTIRVDGTLRFDPLNDTELRVDTMVVTPAGAFEMGTLRIPIQPNVTAKLVIADSGPIDRQWDPFGLSRGLINHGRMTVYGAARTSHTSLTIPPRAGTNLLLLSDAPIGWRAGDTIVLAGADMAGGQDEVREILAINGRLVWIDPLQYSHLAPDPSLGVHVANLSRNAVVKSENAALDRRGHVMFMHTRNVNVNYAGFYHLGRSNKLEIVNDPVVDGQWNLQDGTGTNPRARYPIHFHRNGVTNDGNPAVVRGSVILESPGWGYVNHSSFVEITDNVAYDVDGAAFVTEAGDEIGVFRKNIAIHSVGSGEEINSREFRNDFGHQGDGFWFQGAGIAVTDNIAAGHAGHAFVVYAHGLNHGKVDQQDFQSANLLDPSLAGGNTTIDVQHVPMREFRNNVGYASGSGLMLRYHLRDAEHGQSSVFERSAFWNNTTGIELLYTQNVVLRDLTIVRPFSLDEGTGVDTNLVTRDITFENLTVRGYWRGLDLPRSGYSIVRGGHYNNVQSIVVRMPISVGRSVLVTGDIQFGTFPDYALRGEKQYQVYLRPQIEFAGLTKSRALLDTSITLNYGRFSNASVYYHAQRPDFVPFPSAEAGIPSSYLGLTNAQLWNRFHVAVGGVLATSAAKEAPGVFGLVVNSP